MSNSPQQQAELYRKAAETIEMCAPHGITPLVKWCRDKHCIASCTYEHNYDSYEFPIAVIEGQLVWADTVVYNGYGVAYKAGEMLRVGLSLKAYTLSPPKQPLCEVEGKPVYKGDKLWCGISNHQFIVKELINGKVGISYEIPYNGRVCTSIDYCSWNPPKRTVMVELLLEDVEYWANERGQTLSEINARIARREESCRKALDNLK